MYRASIVLGLSFTLNPLPNTVYPPPNPRPILRKTFTSKSTPLSFSVSSALVVPAVVVPSLPHPRIATPAGSCREPSSCPARLPRLLDGQLLLALPAAAAAAETNYTGNCSSYTSYTSYTSCHCTGNCSLCACAIVVVPSTRVSSFPGLLEIW
ncbi:hypothetical protein B0I35DRAFT_479183 [Stachybotrys elegans]|uniref:Uncharacterized protein n=1 Tax=Stachybotrys elegans TaxID=80388 RepID=A0A8K0WSN3_9HYPO|nr:hypothetical protein B0I35DRAFT_479183 [Stachybotrys elegans]